MATVASCIITLVATTVGSTVLGMPSKFESSGPWLASFLMLCVACIADCSLIALSRAGDYVRARVRHGEAGVEKPDMEQIASRLLGKTWEIVLRLALVLLLTFAAVLFLCIFSDAVFRCLQLFMPGWDSMVENRYLAREGHALPGQADAAGAHAAFRARYGAGADRPLTDQQWMGASKDEFGALVYLVAVLLCYPLTTKDSLESLKFTSLLSNIAMTYMMLVCVVMAVLHVCGFHARGAGSAAGAAADAAAQTAEAEDGGLMGFVAAILSTIGAVATSFCNQFNVLELKWELEQNPANRAAGAKRANIETVIHVGMLICFLLNMLFGWCGYFLAGGKDIPSNISNSPDISGNLFGKLAIILVGTSNIFRYPLIVVPLRNVLRGLRAELRSYLSGAQEGARSGEYVEMRDEEKKPDAFRADFADTVMFAGLAGAAKGSQLARAAEGRKTSSLASEHLAQEASPLVAPPLSETANAFTPSASSDGETAGAEAVAEEEGFFAKNFVFVEMLLINGMIAFFLFMCKDVGTILDVLSWNGIPVICFVLPGMVYAACYSDARKHVATLFTQFKLAGSEGGATTYSSTASAPREETPRAVPAGMGRRFAAFAGRSRCLGYVLASFGVFVAFAVFTTQQLEKAKQREQEAAKKTAAKAAELAAVSEAQEAAHGVVVAGQDE